MILMIYRTKTQTKNIWVEIQPQLPNKSNSEQNSEEFDLLLLLWKNGVFWNWIRRAFCIVSWFSHLKQIFTRTCTKKKDRRKNPNIFSIYIQSTIDLFNPPSSLASIISIYIYMQISIFLSFIFWCGTIISIIIYATWTIL